MDEGALLSVDDRMVLSQVLEALDGELIGDPPTGHPLEFTTCFAADLMSASHSMDVKPKSMAICP